MPRPKSDWPTNSMKRPRWCRHCCRDAEKLACAAPQCAVYVAASSHIVRLFKSARAVFAGHSLVAHLLFAPTPRTQGVKHAHSHVNTPAAV
eukprot:2217089-Prymnesium_polylepis.1